MCNLMNILNILDRLIESKMASWEWRLGGGEIEQKGERTHGHGQQCGDCLGEGHIRGLKGNINKKTP